MAMTWRTGVLFAGGLLLGAALGGWGVMQARDTAKWEDHMGPTAAMGNAPAPAAAASAAAPDGSAAPQPLQAHCDTTSIVGKGAEDGRETLQASPRTASKDEVSSLILTGKEAAASGRMRDAEIAFLNACRNAEVLQGEDAALGMADAMYQLGRHYANIAPTAARKQDLLARAQRLLTAALQTYQARYGAGHEKTRFAQQGLATVQQVAGGSAPAAAPEPARQVAKAPPKPATPAPKIAAAPAPQPAQAVPARAETPAAAEVRPEPAKPAPKAEAPKAEAPKAEAPKAEAAPPVAPRPQAAQPQRPSPRALADAQDAAPAPSAPTRSARPSFDCARARSAAEKIICADEDLARQDRELARLHDKAEGAAGDRRAFRQQNDEHWSRRERECQDRECVQRWYAQRRAQLQEAARAPEPAPRTAETPRPVERERPAATARRDDPSAADVPVAPPTSSMGAPTAEGSTGLEQ